MTESEARPGRGNVIGGRHGSPSVTIALPFSKITGADDQLRDAIADLASIVARLAANTTSGDENEIELVKKAAEELATRLSAHQ